jgi:amidohydrolase
MILTYKEITDYCQEIFEDLKHVRRHLHANPEIGRQEFNTAKYIQKELEGFGNFNIENVAETGFCTDLIVDMQKPLVALRGDMDALPVPDKKDVSYRSRIPEMCHACGHDFHATVILGVARTLHNFKGYLKGNVRFIFQHAEELTPGGAIDFVNAGKLNDVQAIFGLHVDPSIAVGKLRLVPGSITAQSIYVKIELKGEGGHSARPSETADPIYIGTLILNELYGGLYRLQKAENPFVFTIGKVEGGDSFNTIATSIVIEGTLRVTNQNQADALLSFIATTVDQISSKWGLNSNFHYTKGAIPVINDPDLTNTADNIISKILTKDQIITEGRTLGGEDFSEFLRVTPGLFIRIGVGNNNMAHAVLHSSYFDIDEKAIPFSVSLFSWLIISYLDLQKQQ